MRHKVLAQYTNSRKKTTHLGRQRRNDVMYRNLVYIIIIYVFNRTKQHFFHEPVISRKRSIIRIYKAEKIYTLQRKRSSETNIHRKLSTTERATTAGKLRRVSQTVGFEIF
jgi:hypothetical protein